MNVACIYSVHCHANGGEYDGGSGVSVMVLRSIWPVSMAASSVDNGRCCARGCLMPLAKCTGIKKGDGGNGVN